MRILILILQCITTAAATTSFPSSFSSSSTLAAFTTSSSLSSQYSTISNTNYTTTVPETGVIREYYFNLEQITASPDGRERFALAINGSIPGPTIEADWDDTAIVHVTNSLPDSAKNGTSVHFHGIRHYYANPMDGVVSITQCPTARGSTVTYKWRAMQYGTTWYHSHIGLNHGRGSLLYDNADRQRWITDGTPRSVEGTSYRLRLVNAAVDTHFNFMVDNHTLTVIANDLVPIQPYETTVLDIAMGQRYDVIITADQASVADSFWLRAIPQEACSENESSDNIRGIIYYGSSTSAPKTSAYDYADSCSEEDPSNLTPVVNPLSVSSSPFYTKSEPVTLGANAENLFRWKLNSTSMHVDWTDPSLLEIYRNHSANEWVYVAIETELSVPHPIHLHGHDFVIVAQGTGTYNSSSDNLINNWEGFAMQFIERYSEIQDLLKTKYSEGLEENCQSWEQYQEEYMVVEDDSGV
ncbi:Cupredoxin [Aspergillus foveolatus]|uniref:Cupredoxin n=1 Tax=Aspergillus foveolatus TaxID=210207 RepID=UPI003CCD0412